MIILTGLLASIGMVVFFSLFKRLGFLSFDVVEVIGSFVSRVEEGSYFIGIVIHIVFGILFGAIYEIAFRLVPIPKDLGDPNAVYLTLGLGLGIVHGMLAAVILSSLLKYHPVARYRKKAFPIAALYALATILYGILVGWTK